MSDWLVERLIHSISIDAGGCVREVVDHQLGSDEIYVYEMNVGRDGRQRAVEKQHINATLELIFNLFNKGRHHAGGAEAICRHITLKIPSEEAVPRIFAWVTDVGNYNEFGHGHVRLRKMGLRRNLCTRLGDYYLCTRRRTPD